jgi:hypothetical protein
VKRYARLAKSLIRIQDGVLRRVNLVKLETQVSSVLRTKLLPVRFALPVRNLTRLLNDVLRLANPDKLETLVSSVFVRLDSVKQGRPRNRRALRSLIFSLVMHKMPPTQIIHLYIYYEVKRLLFNLISKYIT